MINYSIILKHIFFYVFYQAQIFFPGVKNIEKIPRKTLNIIYELKASINVNAKLYSATIKNGKCLLYAYDHILATGAATAIHFAKLGASLAITGRNIQA